MHIFENVATVAVIASTQHQVFKEQSTLKANLKNLSLIKCILHSWRKKIKLHSDTFSNSFQERTEGVVGSNRHSKAERE